MEKCEICDIYDNNSYYHSSNDDSGLLWIIPNVKGVCASTFGNLHNGCSHYGLSHISNICIFSQHFSVAIHQADTRNSFLPIVYKFISFRLKIHHNTWKCAPGWYLFLSCHSKFGVGCNLSSSSTIFQTLILGGGNEQPVSSSRLRRSSPSGLKRSSRFKNRFF